jgi:hypothetical protein
MRRRFRRGGAAITLGTFSGIVSVAVHPKQRHRQDAVGRALILRRTACVLAVSGLVCLPATALAGTCPNESLRNGAATSLPECRAYEMVSPVNKNGSDVTDQPLFYAAGQAAASGDGIVFESTGAFVGALSSLNDARYFSSRLGGAWLTHPLEVPVTNEGTIYLDAYLGSDEELDKSVVSSTSALAPGAVQGQMNLYLRDNVKDTLKLIASSNDPSFRSSAESGSEGNGDLVRAATPDFSHLLLITTAALTPDALANGNPNVYVWSEAGLALASRLPDETVDPNGSKIETSSGANRIHAISSDGSRIFFESGSASEPEAGGDGALYVRENDERTTAISVSQGSGGPVGPQPATFAGASTDGSIVYFLASANLTDASRQRAAEVQEEREAEEAGHVEGELEIKPYTESKTLYRYDLVTHQLTDLTIDKNPADNGQHRGLGGPKISRVIQGSDDGSDVYFEATGTLTTGAALGEEHIYFWHDGQIKLVTGLGVAAGSELAEAVGASSGSPNGRYLAFDVLSKLSSYDNAAPACQARNSGTGVVNGVCREVYVYNDAAEALECASCDPSGAIPLGEAHLGAGDPSGGEAFSRGVLDDGSVFFDTPDPLVSSDSNGQRDVYRWRDGIDELISTGQSEQASTFFDASASGNDVFFRTSEQLVPQDTDSNVDVYDARVDGGIAGQHPSLGSPQCHGESCRQPTSEVPPTASPASSSFIGPASQAPFRTTPPTSSPPRISVSLGSRDGAVAAVVKVPGKGRIRLAGSGLRDASRAVTKAGSYTLKSRLDSQQRGALRHGRRIRLEIRVVYTNSNGVTTSVARTLTVRGQRG